MRVTCSGRSIRGCMGVKLIAGGLIGMVMFGTTMASVTSAQVLDLQVNSLLANNCANLLQGAGSGVLGASLAAVCTGATGATGSGTSAGGGAASVQSSAASILNRKVVSESDETRKGLGFFFTGTTESLSRDVTTFQDGYSSTILGMTAGADYRFNAKTVAGLAVKYANTHGDFKSGGDFNTNSIGFTLFGSYLPTDRTFIQLAGGYSNNNYLVTRSANAFVPGLAGGADRVVSGFASSNSNADVFSANALVGYDHPVGMFTIGPRGGINYTNTHIHDYAETGSAIGLKVDDQYINSLQSVLGVQGQAAISTGFGVLVPQVNADYIHEFANSQRFINVSFVEDLRATPLKFTFQNEVPVRNYFNLGTGLLVVLPNGVQGFVNFRAMVGNEQFNNYVGTFGLRLEM